MASKNSARRPSAAPNASIRADQNDDQSQIDLYKSGRIPEELIKIFMASNRGEEIDVAPDNGVAFQMFRRGKVVPRNNQSGLAMIDEEESNVSYNNAKSSMVYPSNKDNEDNIWRSRSLFRSTVQQNDQVKRSFLSRAFGARSRKKSESSHSIVSPVQQNNSSQRTSVRMSSSPSTRMLVDEERSNQYQPSHNHEESESSHQVYDSSTNPRRESAIFNNDVSPLGPNNVDKPKKGIRSKLNPFRLARNWNKSKANKSKGDAFVDENNDQEQKQLSLELQLQQQPSKSLKSMKEDVIGSQNYHANQSSNSITETTASVSTPALNSITCDDSYNAPPGTTASSITHVLNNTSTKSLSRHYRPPISSDDYMSNRHDDDDSPKGNSRIISKPVTAVKENVPSTAQEPTLEIRPIRHMSSSISNDSSEADLIDDDPCSLQEYFDKMLDSRGYSTETFATLSTAFHNDATPLQEASYSSHTVKLVKAGDAQNLKTMLSCGLSPNPSNYYGESLLHIVCRMGNENMLRVMLDCGAIVQVSDDVGRTPLHNACWAKGLPNFPAVELLLEKDVFLMQLTDSRGSTPLAYAREEHWPEWKLFLNKVADRFWPDANACTDKKKRRRLTETPVLARLSPNTFPMKDPPNALNLELARMVAVGTIAPEDAMLLQDEDFQDSLNGDEDDEDDDDDDIDDGEGDAASCTSTGNKSGKSGHSEVVFDENHFSSSKDSVHCDSTGLGDSTHHSILDDNDIEEMLSRIASSTKT